jgi:hypothetical protein
MSQWYYIDASSNNQSTDEDTLAQMYRSGQINNDTYVWSEGTGPDWKPISALPQLIAKLKPAQTTSMPPRAGGGIGANIAAQAAQNKKLGPLDSNNMGAPVPVSTGTDNRALNIVKRQEPSHGWKVCSIYHLFFILLSILLYFCTFCTICNYQPQFHLIELLPPRTHTHTHTHTHTLSSSLLGTQIFRRSTVLL